MHFRYRKEGAEFGKKKGDDTRENYALSCVQYMAVGDGYQSTRHTVNSSPVNSSHTRLITQSTRHKRAHNKTTSTSRNYLHAVRRHPETVGVIFRP